MHIALLPLDERPVCAHLPTEIARIAGAEVEVPPHELMSAMRRPGDTARLARWLEDRADDPRTSHMIVALDMLAYGGILPARITHDRVSDVLGRLATLDRIRERRPDLIAYAVSLVMRASNSYSAVEEPEYWSQVGRELHRVGASLHGQLLAEVAATVGAATPDYPDEPPVPSSMRSDFERRRMRNHIVNLGALEQLDRGVLDFLAITADDTATLSAGSVEQVWLRHWARALRIGPALVMYPGADEVGSVLVARALAASAGLSPAVDVVCANPDGLQRVPNFENQPIAAGIAGHLTAAGARMAEDGEAADLTLVVHAPDPDRQDAFGATPASDPAAVAATLAAVRAALDRGHDVGLADVRYSNGGDPLLVDELHRAGLLLELDAYGGWNTAGNTVGGVVAHCVARTVGRSRGSLDETASRTAFLRRLLDDCAYQSVIRPALHSSSFGGAITPVDEPLAERAADEIHRRLAAELARLTGAGSGWTLDSVALPWKRSFEVTLEIRHEPGAANGQPARP